MQGLGPVDGQKHFPFTRLPRGVQFTPRLVQLFEAFEHPRLLLTLERVLEWESCVDSSRDLRAVQALSHQFDLLAPGN